MNETDLSYSLFAPILSMIGCLGLSALFSGTETAFTSLSPSQIERLRHVHGRRGTLIAHFAAAPQLLLGTVLFGNNLMNIAASVLASDITIRLFGSAALGITTGALTLVVLIFGEVTPKQMAIIHNEFWALHTVRAVWILSIVLRPAVWLVGLVGTLTTRLTGRGRRAQVTRETLLQLVTATTATGFLEQFKSQVMRNVLRFSDLTVGSIMTHRTKIFSLSARLTAEEALPQLSASGFSRAPIYADHPEHVVGIALLKDVVRTMADERPRASLQEIAKPAIIVPENRHIDELFSRFRREKLNMAIIRDEYGGVAGLVTLEDIIEEILGEIYDEHEAEEGSKVRSYGRGRFLIKADIPIHELNAILDLKLPVGRHINTLGGYLVSLIDHLPTVNELIDTPIGSFIVRSTSGKQVDSVMYRPSADHPYKARILDNDQR